MSKITVYISVNCYFTNKALNIERQLLSEINKLKEQLKEEQACLKI